MVVARPDQRASQFEAKRTIAQSALFALETDGFIYKPTIIQLNLGGGERSQ